MAKYVKLKDVKNLIENERDRILGNDGYSDQRLHALHYLKNRLSKLKKYKS